jgi:putative flavoprotein involved in K+ transport
MEYPAAIDDLGFPFQENGSSTVIEGLHFMGVHFQRKRKSANFVGVAEDAAVLGEDCQFELLDLGPPDPLS